MGDTTQKSAADILKSKMDAIDEKRKKKEADEADKKKKAEAENIEKGVLSDDEYAEIGKAFVTEALAKADKGDDDDGDDDEGDDNAPAGKGKGDDGDDDEDDDGKEKGNFGKSIPSLSALFEKSQKRSKEMKNSELLAKSAETIDEIVRDYEPNEIIKAMAEGFGAIFTVLKSQEDKIAELQSQVEAGGTGEGLAKSFEEAAKVFDDVKDMLKSHNERLDKIERTPVGVAPMAVLSVKDAQARLAKSIENRYNDTSTLAKSVQEIPPATVSDILLKSVQAGELPNIVVTKFDLHGKKLMAMDESVQRHVLSKYNAGNK